jgi:ribonuclease HII
MAFIEETLRAAGITRVAGVDEAGRGPCAGPLVVAAVILKDFTSPALAQVRDSKAISEKFRESLFDLICEQAISYAIIEISVEEIDKFGLHKSNIEGMRRAIGALDLTPEYVLTDGYAIAGLALPNLAVWKGDQVAMCISAASILAKVYRDRKMRELDVKYPEYGLASHKGYISSGHTEAIRLHGVRDFHRKSFSNIQRHLKNEGS